MDELMLDLRLDLRGLLPPEPMERVLDALSSLAPGQRVLMLIEREPRPLYRILLENGYQYRAQVNDAGLYRILIWEGSR